MSTGVYVFPAPVIEHIDEYLSNGNRDSPGYFIQWLLAKGEAIRAYRFSDYWYDIGSADSYLEALRTLLKESHIEEIQISPASTLRARQRKPGKRNSMIKIAPLYIQINRNYIKSFPYTHPVKS